MGKECFGEAPYTLTEAIIFGQSETMRVFAILWTAVVCSVSLDVHAGIQVGREKFLRGDYLSAIDQYRAVKGKNRSLAQVLLAETYLRLGRYQMLEKTVRQLQTSRNRSVSLRTQLLRARYFRITGRYREAIKLLTPLQKQHSNSAQLRYLLAMVHRDMGNSEATTALLQQFIHDWNNGTMEETNAQQTFYVAEAVRYASSYQEANDMFRQTVANDVSFYVANIAWGDLFLDKYAVDHAQKSFSEVLRQDPNHPDAHAGMARAKLEKTYDVASAGKHIQHALATNPHHIPALLVRARIEIDQNRWGAVQKTLGKVLTINANSYAGSHSFGSRALAEGKPG